MRKLSVFLIAILAGPALWMASTMTATDASAAAQVRKQAAKPVSRPVSHATTRRVTTHTTTNRTTTNRTTIKTTNKPTNKTTLRHTTNRRVTTTTNTPKHVTKHTTTRVNRRTTTTTSKPVHPSKPVHVVRPVTHHKLVHPVQINKPKKVVHDPKHKVGKLGLAHNHKPLVIWHKGHYYKRIYYTVLIGGIATWYWYDDLVPDDDGYVTTLTEVPYCDDDSDDCGMRPVPARARPAPAARRGCLVSVYDERDFDGAVWTTSADQPDLGDKWSNRITSVQVISGTWDFFLEPKYQNEMLTLENGTYPYVGDDWKDQINSFRCTPQ